MWKCPKCGRAFKNMEQDHFCVKPSSIDEYIAAQPEAVRPLLQSIRETIRAAAPEATEKISWQMPTFWVPTKSRDFVGRGGATEQSECLPQGGCSSTKSATTRQGENLIHFAAFKKHIGLYPGGEATSEFAERLAGYKTSKGAIQLPLGKPIDYELITDIVRWRLEHTR